MNKDDPVLKEIERLQHSEMWRSDMDQAGSGFLNVLVFMVLLPVNVPLAIAVLFGLDVWDKVLSAVGRHMRLSKAVMPDSWLASVSKHPEISRESIRELERLLERNGKITVLEAIHWAEHEAARHERSTAQQEAGARALMERAAADAECLTFIERLQRTGGEIGDLIVSFARSTGAVTANVLVAFVKGVLHKVGL